MLDVVEDKEMTNEQVKEKIQKIENKMKFKER